MRSAALAAWVLACDVVGEPWFEAPFTSGARLADNKGVRDAGILALCDALQENTMLETLRLASLAGLGPQAGRAVRRCKE